MFMNVTCPVCGQSCRVPESALGQQVTCPACQQLFQCGSVSPPSLATYPCPADKPAAARATPPARAVPLQPDRQVHYNCPRCTKSLESPAQMAGQKLNCPDCGQRLQVPAASTVPPPVAVNNTLLAAVTPPPSAVPQVPVAAVAPPPPPPSRTDVLLEVVPVRSPPPVATPREYCLECGVNITERPRVQTCPDCGSLFCSAMCYREHRHHAHSSRR